MCIYTHINTHTLKKIVKYVLYENYFAYLRYETKEKER